MILGAIFGLSWADLGQYWCDFSTILGQSWGHFGAMLGNLGTILGNPGGIFGPSWSQEANILIFPRAFNDFGGNLGAILGHLEASLGPAWGHLGPSWGHLGQSWAWFLGLEGQLNKYSSTPSRAGGGGLGEGERIYPLKL